MITTLTVVDTEPVDFLNADIPTDAPAEWRAELYDARALNAIRWGGDIVLSAPQAPKHSPVLWRWLCDIGRKVKS